MGFGKIVLILVPALAASAQEMHLSESVRKLVHNPRSGPGRLTLNNHKRATGYILRVTDQFIAFRDARSHACEDIRLSDIAAIEVRNGGLARDAGDVLTAGIFAVASAVDKPQRGDSTDLEHITGYWRATHASPDGTFSSVGIGLVEKGRVFRRQVRMMKGKYRVENDSLVLSETGQPDETIRVRFVCDALILERSPAPIRMILAENQSPHPADHPIVGTWREDFSNGTTFRADGTFQMERIESTKEGHFQQNGNRLNVKWNSDSTEDWELRAGDHHLFITVDGKTSEYERPALRGR